VPPHGQRHLDGLEALVRLDEVGPEPSRACGADRVVAEQRYASGGIDGIAAILPWDAVYALTYGGIVRYDVSSGGDPVPVDDSYQPAVDLSTGTSYATEELELGVVQSTGKQTLFSPSARGGFTMWQIDDHDRRQTPER